jgi:glutaredoxin
MAKSDPPVQALSNLNEERKIVVYTSNGCRKCAMLKEWLKTAHRSFEERSLENVEVMTELVMRDIVVLSAPVLEVDKNVYSEAQFFDGNALIAGKLQSILEGTQVV